MPRKRTQAVKDTQSNYEAEQLARGKHVHLTANLKSAEDVAMYRRLADRFGDNKSKIVKLALNALDAQANTATPAKRPRRKA